MARRVWRRASGQQMRLGLRSLLPEMVMAMLVSGRASIFKQQAYSYAAAVAVAAGKEYDSQFYVRPRSLDTYLNYVVGPQWDDKT